MNPAVTAIASRRVSMEELRQALTEPISSEERQEILPLRQWFSTRYPGGDDRLAYVRRAYRRWRPHT
jgi:hypothetical protein